MLGSDEDVGLRLLGEAASLLWSSFSLPAGRPGVMIRPWIQQVQGQRCFQWEMSKVTRDEMAMPESKFHKIVLFTMANIQGLVDRWKFAQVGKFLGCGFSLEFVKRKL